MSGLYNVLFGVNKFSHGLLGALNVEVERIPRFRDCFLNEAGTAITIYTRAGGGNRPSYIDEIAYMRSIPGYVEDHDDSFDATYALFTYSIPDSLKHHIDSLKAAGACVDPGKRWENTIARLGKEMPR